MSWEVIWIILNNIVIYEDLIYSWSVFSSYVKLYVQLISISSYVEHFHLEIDAWSSSFIF